jgi:hypothetical protein
VCGRKPADPYPDQEYVVRRCLKVVLKKQAEHHRYAVRDLAVLEAEPRWSPSDSPAKWRRGDRSPTMPNPTWTLTWSLDTRSGSVRLPDTPI